MGGTFKNPLPFDSRPETLDKVHGRAQELVSMEQKSLDELSEKLNDPRG